MAVDSGRQADPAPRSYTLIGPDRRPFSSSTPGAFGGYRSLRIYGRLDCPSALRAIAAGGYIKNRVFFLDEASAVMTGYRPCARCMPQAYRAWEETGSEPR